ncbi:hypothetical protein PVAND_011709 [Polypedilum vanderplanki]|uniref:Vacuolar ATPase assembly integral membrane protein VMA21 homolog n=1 Tax=Polypedilum vanderplanki TaxID=319348 RepID=A0A9J6CKA1_POLVA|nr:hypothetical protein PVAND_011709 [Polypedilum vanderplanki]
MSKQKKNNKSLLNEESKTRNKTDFSVFLTVFFYCILIILLPVLSFFGSKYVFETFFDFSNVLNNIYAAVVAVINLHIALGLYLYKAYSQPDPKQSVIFKQD